MPDYKTILRTALCTLLVVSLVGCAPEPVADELEQSSQPIEAEDALRVATGWLQERYPEAAPDVQWKTETSEAATSESDAAAGTSVLRAFAGDWGATFSKPATPEEHEILSDCDSSPGGMVLGR